MINKRIRDWKTHYLSVQLQYRTAAMKQFTDPRVILGKDAIVVSVSKN